MYIEVALQPSSAATAEQVRPPVLDILAAAGTSNLVDGDCLDLSSNPQLAAHVKHARVFDVPGPAGGGGGGGGSSSSSPPTIHVHPLFDEEAAEEDAGDGESVAFQLFTLPSLEFDGLWESLVYDEEVQPRLLRYVSTAMTFSRAGVDERVIAWNRVVLLHGPPGTGKTSLCRGLAHKLAIRMSEHYAQGHLVEVNAHSLFSKWFSESGKMVMHMFARIRELLDDGDSFVCVLVDEVESLAATRNGGGGGGSEPSDAIRVVNALLTQLDQLKRYPNALVLTTSNLTGAIDAAFIDRADIKQYIGNPGAAARYQILRTCVHELGRVGLLAPFDALAPPATLRSLLPSPTPSFEQIASMPGPGSQHGGAAVAATRHSMLLYAVAEACDGLSGRALRKLPFLAHALFGGGGGGGGGGDASAAQGGPMPIELYLVALRRAVEHERGARGALGGNAGP